MPVEWLSDCSCGVECRIYVLFFFFFFLFFFKQKTAYEITVWLEFRRVLFRSSYPKSSVVPYCTAIMLFVSTLVEKETITPSPLVEGVKWIWLISKSPIAVHWPRSMIGGSGTDCIHLINQWKITITITKAHATICDDNVFSYFKKRQHPTRKVVIR